MKLHGRLTCAEHENPYQVIEMNIENKNSLYFDYQASCPVDPKILEDMTPLWYENAGNPHSANHSIGWEADKKVSNARAQIAALIGAERDEIIFTSGATEANNLAILGLAERAENSGRSRIVVSAIEHKCVLASARAAADRLGFHVETIGVNADGMVDLENLARSLNEDVLVVSVMAVNNEVGSIQDIAKISSLTKTCGAILHCDAAQAPVATNVGSLSDHADLISLSGHKMYAPQGIGALRVPLHLQSAIEPRIYGGGQQDGLRSGTVPMPLSVGMGAAANILHHNEAETERERVRTLRDRFVELVQLACPEVMINGPKLVERHPGNANLLFPGVSGDDILLSLQPMLAASTGAACTSGIPEPSHVLRAMGLDGDSAESSVRFSFGRFSDESQIEVGAELVINAYQELLAA